MITIYRKKHQQFLRNHKIAQYGQYLQSKTWEHFHLRASFATTLRFQEYEAFRRILSRKLLRLLKIILIKKPYNSVTAKPKEMRMGKGKGAFSHFHLPLRAGLSVMNFFWCHQTSKILLLYHVKNAIKKSRQLFLI